MESESQFVMRGIAKSLNSYAFRVANIAEKMNNMSKVKNANDCETEFAALLTSLIAMADYFDAHWQNGVGRYLDDHRNDSVGLKKYQELTAAMVNADLDAIHAETREHFKDSSFGEEE